jgi:hypothetical protein
VVEMTLRGWDAVVADVAGATHAQPDAAEVAEATEAADAQPPPAT